MNQQPDIKETTMENHSEILNKIVQIDEDRIKDHLGVLLRGTVEETLNAMLETEADRLCGASRYEI